LFTTGTTGAAGLVLPYGWNDLLEYRTELE